MRRITIMAMLLLALSAQGVSAASPTLPDRIDLPNGFAPEGIAIGQGTTFYTGSLAGAGIWRGDVERGDGSLLVTGGGPFVGMKVDAWGRLWVAGGPAGNGYAFDSGTGDLIATFPFASAPTFVNDVVVTRDAAWFTDSMRPVLYRVAIDEDGAIGTVSTVDLAGQVAFVDGAFNFNGITASRDGRTLVVVNSTTGELYAVNARRGTASLLDLDGESVTNGDGILLVGRRLYVVRNQLNQIAVFRVNHDLERGRLVEVITSEGFDVPTTIARRGDSLYAVNARFGTDVTPETEYWVTRAER